MMSLDVMRGIAILLVLGRHWKFPESTGNSVHEVLTQAWHRGGWVGVDLFFVLSGFLVGGLLFAEYRKHGRMDIPRFYIRRGFKIYPSFYIFILFSVGALILQGADLQPFQILRECFFVQNYLRGLWGHTWSLAIEEQFYFLLPLLLAGCLRPHQDSPVRRRLLVATILTICLCVPVLRFASSSAHADFGVFTHHFPLHLRVDSLFWGVLLAYAYHFHREPLLAFCNRYRPLLLSVGVAALVPAFVFKLETTPFLWTAGYTLFAWGSCALLLATLQYDCSCFPGARLLATIGFSSYSIYLWHALVRSIVAFVIEQQLGPGYEYLGCVLYVIASILFGIRIGQLIETPFLQLRDRVTLPAQTVLA